VVAVVLQAPGKKAELCPGVLTSMPPQCSGPAIRNWRWADVEGSSSFSGVTSGTYRVVGTYGDGRFTLTEKPTVATFPPAVSVGTTPGCPEPSGGWPTASVTFAQYQQFVAAAQSPSDFAGLWVHQLGPVANPGKDIYTLAYTGDIATHEAALRAIWPGPLCVVEHSRSLAQLQAVEAAVTSDPRGLVLISSAADQVRNVVTIEAILATRADQQKLDRRFGSGIVQITSWLQPVG